MAVLRFSSTPTCITKGNFLMKFRKAAILIIFCSASFALGAVWLKTKMFPYKYLTELPQVALLSKQVSGAATATLPNTCLLYTSDAADE